MLELFLDKVLQMPITYYIYMVYFSILYKLLSQSLPYCANGTALPVSGVVRQWQGAKQEGGVRPAWQCRASGSVREGGGGALLPAILPLACEHAQKW